MAKIMKALLSLIALFGVSPAIAGVLYGPVSPGSQPLVAPPAPTPVDIQSWVNQLRSWHLQIPLDGISPESFKGSFYSMRGNEAHHAADMLAPRNTPVHAVEDGKIARLFVSKLGGNTIYEVDPTGQYVYYYAHLEKYADDIHEGDHVSKGQLIGFVGTSGNAPPNTPHLHFSVERIAAGGSVFHGTPVDPYEVFRQSANSVSKPKDPTPMRVQLWQI